MERKLAEFRARKKAQTEAEKPAVREIQIEMKPTSDDSLAVSPDKTEFLKPNNNSVVSPHKQVWSQLTTIETMHSNTMIKLNYTSLFPPRNKIK